MSANRSAGLLLLVLLGACAPSYTPRRPQPIAIRHNDNHPPLSTCQGGAERGAPQGGTPSVTAKGELSVADVRGDDRLSMARAFVTTWSEDGEKLFMATRERVLVWQPATGELIRSLPFAAPLERATGIARSPNGAWLAVTGTQPGGEGTIARVTLFNLVDGTRREVAGLAAPLRFSPDGRTLFGHGRYLDLATLRVSQDPVTGIDRREFPDGRRYLDFTAWGQGASRHYVPALRRRGGKLLRRFSPVAIPHAAAVSGDGARIAVLGDGALQVFSTTSQEPLAEVKVSLATQMVSLSHDGRRAVIESVTCGVLASVTLTPGPADRMSRVAACPAPSLALWDLDVSTRLWETKEGAGDGWVFSADGSHLTGPRTRLVDDLRRTSDGTTVTFGERIFSLSPDGRWVLFQGTSGLELGRVDGGETSWRRVRRAKLRALSNDDAHRLTVADRVLRLESAGACTELGPISWASERSMFSSDGRLLMTVGRDPGGQSVRVYDTTARAMRWSMHLDGPEASSARVFSSGEQIFVQGNDHERVLRFDLASGAPLESARVPRRSYDTPFGGGATVEVRDHDGDRVSHLYIPSLSRDGSRLANVEFFDSDAWIALWDLRSPERVVDRRAGGHPSHVVASPDGTSWAVAYRDGGVGVLRQDGHSFVEMASSHADVITALRFTPSGHRLVSASRDGAIIVSDPTTGQRVGSAHLPIDFATHLALPHDGRIIAETGRRMRVSLHIAAPSRIVGRTHR